MLISSAYAQDAMMGAGQGAAGEVFMMQMLFLVAMVVLFYVLMIMPQQKRFKKHREMLNELKKGDRVTFAGGLVGKIDKIKDGDEEVSIEIAKDVKVTALRSTIQGATGKVTTKAAEKKADDKAEKVADKKDDKKKK